MGLLHFMNSSFPLSGTGASQAKGKKWGVQVRVPKQEERAESTAWNRALFFDTITPKTCCKYTAGERTGLLAEGKTAKPPWGMPVTQFSLRKDTP